MSKRPIENQEAATRLAKRLRSDPNRTTDIASVCKTDQEKAIEDADPKPFVYQTPLIFAFPTSLAVVKSATFEYDCTPWLFEPLDDLRLLWTINAFASQHRRNEHWAIPKATPMVRLGTGTTSYVHIYAVFPHLETIGKTAKCRTFKKWHDMVVLPALEGALAATGYHVYAEEWPPTHRLAVLNSQAERVEMGRPDAPLTPIITQVCQENLSSLWNAIVRKTTQKDFEEFGDVFLAVVFDHLAESASGAICRNLTNAETQEKSLTQAMGIWEGTVDMRYVPKGNMEYRVETTWRI